MSVNTLRNLSFLVLLSTLVVAKRAEVLAWDSGWGVGAVYQQWEYSYDCHASGFYNWDSEINCEFDPDAEWPNDPYTLSGALADELYSACDATCNDLRYLDWREWSGNYPYPASESYLRECWVTWSQFTSNGGPTAFAKCKCSGFYLCEW
jgi:hypothetical protein